MKKVRAGLHKSGSDIMRKMPTMQKLMSMTGAPAKSETMEEKISTVGTSRVLHVNVPVFNAYAIAHEDDATHQDDTLAASPSLTRSKALMRILF
eukprot:gene15126-21181_t